MTEIIDINEKNIEKQEMFCKKTKKKLNGYQSKLKWIKERFKEGLKYKLLMVKENGKKTSRGMIEYIPGEYNWRGIKADGWMVIHCLWVVGRHKEKGYGSRLLECAIQDAKKAGMHGVIGMTADKGGWLPKTKLYEKLGFEKVDEIEPYFSLYAKAFSKDAPTPNFYPISDEKTEKYESGVTIFYTDQCPYIVDLVDDIKEMNNKKKVKIIKFDTCMEAQENGLYPYGTYFVSINGKKTLYQHSLKRQIQNALKK
ncbi:MAG: GNAT family N-acetyltransferase [Candidatus Lokiarchaeota archaeon]|nr:GNAT family N-acetyltransferase [Candidatus Lokiarchaeota archaeon]MBD3337521.1 GNAT family N-acetyltransferase [Candidatus Lokiarchaeota archaeon]